MILIEERKTKKLPGESSLFINFTYDAEIVEVIKQATVKNYNKTNKEWEVPLTDLAFLLDRLCTFDKIKISLLKDSKEEKSKDIVLSEYKTKPFSYQLDGIKFGLSHNRWLLLDMPGLGKALSLDTKVLTVEGYKEIRDLSLSDKLFDEKGNLCNIKGIYDHDLLNMYNITFSTGEKITACEDHQWPVIYSRRVWNKSLKKYEETRFEEVHSTKWLFEDERYKKNALRMPFCKPIKFPETSLPLDPYVLGCLIGDGSITRGVEFCSKDAFVIEEISKHLPVGYVMKPITNSKTDYRVVNSSAYENFKSGNEVKNVLKKLGLYGKKSESKFIPDIYKYASVEDRIALLQGLMDTDGTALSSRSYNDKPSNTAQFSTSSSRLRDDFEFLINSLGGYVTVRTFTPRYYSIKYSEYRYGLEHHSITIHLPDNSILFRLPRKRALVGLRENQPRRRIVSIEYKGKSPGRCLTVDSPNHLYLIDKCIVTHNTLQLIYLAQELKERYKIEHCLIICGVNALKQNWVSEITKHSDLSCRILGQRKQKNGKIKIGSISDRVEDLKSKIEEFFVITNIETLRDDKIIKHISSGKVNKFDCIFVDEIHKAKNQSSKQGHNLLKLSAKYMVGATGTLLLNSPFDAHLPLSWLELDNSTASNFKYYYGNFKGIHNEIFLGYRNLEILKAQLDKYSLRRTKDLLDLPPKNIINEYLELNDKQELFYKNIEQGIIDQVDKVELKPANILAMITRLRQATACPSILTSEDIPSTKIDRACELAQQLLEAEEKVVIFSTFKESLVKLKEKLSIFQPVICSGDTADSDINTNINNFQNEVNTKLMLCTWQKMGTGFTLTAASYAIFLDVPWTAALLEQAQDRIYRIGSKKPVFIYHLICKDTVDERVQSIVEDKEAISEYVIDDKISEKHIDNLKKYIEELSKLR